MGLRARAPRFLVPAVCLAPFVIIVDFSAIPIALPSIRSGFGFSPTSLQWVISANLLTFGGFLLAAGRAADVYGRRRLLTFGLLTFTLASLGVATSVTEATLIIGRAFQGLGSAIAFPAALALLTTTFEQPAQRTQALATYGCFMSIALLSGRVLGGTLTAILGWRAVPLLNVLLGALALLAITLVIPNQRRRRERLIHEVSNAAIATLGICAILYGLLEATQTGWFALGPYLFFLLGLGCTLVAFLGDRKSATPLLSKHLLGRETVAGAVVASVASPATGVGVLVVLSFYLQDLLGHSPLQTGLALAFVGLAGTISAKASSRLAHRFGVVNVLVGALLLQAIGVLMLLPIGPTSGVGFVIVGTTVMGAGLSTVAVMIPALGITAMLRRDHGLIAGVTTSAQQIGGAFGLAVLLTIASVRTRSVESNQHTPAPDAVVAGFHWAIAIGALFPMVAACAVFAIVRRARQSNDAL